MSTHSEVLPVTILTGFLGSGKTTLLRRALTSPMLSDTAVIINEIGEIGIDHHLVDFVEGGVVQLYGGCLCCALREDLARTLRHLLDRRDEGRLNPFGRIVVETTGLADPAPILYTLGADPMLDARLSLARVVTVVDAVTGAATIDRFVEAARQVAIADAIVVSKIDLAPFGAELEARVDALNGTAERIIGAGADPGGLLFAASGKTIPDPSAFAGETLHSHGIDAFAVVFGATISTLDFARALGGLAGTHGNDLLRMKGIVGFVDRPDRPALVQAAQHAMFAPEWLTSWPDEDRRSRLVFIVHDIPRAEVLAHFASADPTIVSESEHDHHHHAA